MDLIKVNIPDFNRHFELTIGEIYGRRAEEICLNPLRVVHDDFYLLLKMYQFVHINIYVCL